MKKEEERSVFTVLRTVARAELVVVRTGAGIHEDDVLVLFPDSGPKIVKEEGAEQPRT